MARIWKAAPGTCGCFLLGSVMAWLFHLHNMMKIRTFHQIFFLAESLAKAFGWLFWLFLWDSKGKSINHFQRAGMFFHSPSAGSSEFFPRRITVSIPFPAARVLRRGKPAWTGLWPCGSRRVGNHQGKTRADGAMVAFYFSSPISR